MTVLSLMMAALLVVVPVTDTGTGGNPSGTPCRLPLARETAAEVSETDIDRMANVLVHEVGSLYGEGTEVDIRYADGHTEHYEGSCIIHKIHAQVLLNQLRSPLFPDTMAGCIRTYWAAELAGDYYSRENPTWQHCREDAEEVAKYGFSVPDNVFGATQDPYFGDKYPAYTQWAKVSWRTRWTSGVFYYYEYIGG